MKRVRFILLLVPMLFAAMTFTGFDQAYAQRGGHGGGGGHSGGGGGGHSGGRGGGGFVGHGGGGHFSGRGGGGFVGHGGGRHFDGHGGGHFRGGVFVGGPWFWDPFFYPFYPYYAYPYPSSTVVIERQQPEEYILSTPQPEQQNYWYYCKESRGYYPYVRRCPGGWMKVIPTPPSDQEE